MAFDKHARARDDGKAHELCSRTRLGRERHHFPESIRRRCHLAECAAFTGRSPLKVVMAGMLLRAKDG